MLEHPHLLSPVEAIERLLKQIVTPSRLLVAISGGSDSTGLLLALHECAAHRSGCKVELIAATVDHQLRPESALEARNVSELCAGLGIEHHILQWQGQKPVSGLAAAARSARYNLLSAFAETCNATAILVGHTLDDQIETIAMRQARRSDLAEPAERSGEAGMASAVLLNETVWMLRPFLQTRRHAIRHFLSSRDQGWIDDPSNENLASERVRVRRKLAGLSDSEAVTWSQHIHEAQMRRFELSEQTCDLLKRSLTVSDQVAARLSPAIIAAEPSVLAYALSALLAVLGGKVHAPPGDAIQALVEKLRGGEAFRTTIGRVLVHARKDGIYLVREFRGLSDMRVSAGEPLLWDGRFMVEAEDAATIGPTSCESKRPLTFFDGFPASVANAAQRAKPMVKDVQGHRNTGVSIRPVLRPYMQFLADFDLKLANSLAERMALASFVPLEFNVFSRKT